MNKPHRPASLFAGLAPLHATPLEATLVTEHYPPDNVIFRAGTPDDCLYEITEGSVKLLRHPADSTEVLVAVHGPGDLLGDLSPFGLTARTVTARAITHTAVRRISHEQLRAWMRVHPTLAYRLLSELARRLRTADSALTDLTSGNVRVRVARTIADLADRIGETTTSHPPAEPAAVCVPLTQTDIAELAGVSRETVNRVLSFLTTQGWVRTARRSLIILDLAALLDFTRTPDPPRQLTTALPPHS